MFKPAFVATAITCGMTSVLIAACESEGGGAGSSAGAGTAGVPIVEVIDSAGVRIVETQVPEWSDSNAAPTIDTVPTIRIGSVEDEPYALTDVDGIAVDTAGRIYIADGATLNVRAFSSEGEFLWSSGRSGSGPGEYVDIHGVESCGDTILVGDLYANRLTLLNDSGRVLSTRDWLPLQSFSAPTSFTCHSSGTLAFLDWEVERSADPGPHTVRAVIAGSPPGGEHPQLITEFPGFDRYRYTGTDGPAYFGKSTFIAAGAGEVYVVKGDEAAVYTYDLTGNLRRIARWQVFPQRLTDEMADAQLSRNEKVLPSRIRAGYRKEWRSLVRPEFLPVVAAMVAASNGDLWLQKYTVETTMNQDQTWWVLSPEGVLRGSIRVPHDFELRRISDGFVIGVTKDSLGVEYVEKRRLLAPPG